MQIASLNADCEFSGAGRIRTDDPLLAKQMLYQLSYDPISQCACQDSNLGPRRYQRRALTN
jgi:hypothetical protein